MDFSLTGFSHRRHKETPRWLSACLTNQTFKLSQYWFSLGDSCWTFSRRALMSPRVVICRAIDWLCDDALLFSTEVPTLKGVIMLQVELCSMHTEVSKKRRIWGQWEQNCKHSTFTLRQCSSWAQWAGDVCRTSWQVDLLVSFDLTH